MHVAVERVTTLEDLQGDRAQHYQWVTNQRKLGEADLAALDRDGYVI